MIRLLLDAVFPPVSVGGKTGVLLTPEELALLSVWPIHEDAQCLRRRGIHFLDGMYAAMPYRTSSVVAKTIHSLKYRRIPALHRVLAARMHQGLPAAPPGAVLCPVPLHWSRHFWRGFNQAELLAHVLSVERSIPVLHCLRRVRSTGAQAHRKRKERLHMLRGAFRIPQKIQVPPVVILVDDVATTGATLDACAEALRSAGAKQIFAWLVARA